MDIRIDSITYPDRQKLLKITNEGKCVRLDKYYCYCKIIENENGYNIF